jgi:hypothetical protein
MATWGFIIFGGLFLCTSTSRWVCCLSCGQHRAVHGSVEQVFGSENYPIVQTFRRSRSEACQRSLFRRPVKVSRSRPEIARTVRQSNSAIRPALVANHRQRNRRSTDSAPRI